MEILKVSNSSNVLQLDYDKTSKHLYVTWKAGTRGYYKNISEDVWERLKATDSKGHFLSTYLRNNNAKYPYMSLPASASPAYKSNDEKPPDKVSKADKQAEPKIEHISSQFHQLLREEQMQRK